MEIKEQIQKMNKETCVQELRQASILKGDETDRELNVILEKCQCIQASILFNGFRGK